ncbi:GFA family protein [Thalassobaculum fulvum]|uniref:GFA family protein n=1 Tax=Thalassobaculum fulvum TaxID=1633335 RepID=UPI00167867A2|nr:GFA family protein [Thalassobaculum fulvum]
MTRVLEGGCLCGRTRWRADGPVLHRVHCHCSLCRKGSGAVEVPWITVERRHFAWTGGPPTFYRSSAEGERGFCPVCGTKLTFTHDDVPDDIDLAVGSLDDAEAGYPLTQIHGESRVAWLSVDPQLPFRADHDPGPPVTDPPPLAGDAELEGGCLCGAFRYAVTGPPVRSGLCHCGLCRRATGGLAAAWAIWPRERYRDNGAPTAEWSASATGARRFCPTCGATLGYAFTRRPDLVEIMIAGLDDPGAVAPDSHGFAADAPSWLVIDDTRPRWPGRVGQGEPDDGLLRPAF